MWPFFFLSILSIWIQIRSNLKRYKLENCFLISFRTLRNFFEQKPNLAPFFIGGGGDSHVVKWDRAIYLWWYSIFSTLTYINSIKFYGRYSWIFCVTYYSLISLWKKKNFNWHWKINGKILRIWGFSESYMFDVFQHCASF